MATTIDQDRTARIAHDQAERRRDQAVAYVWGRQDAGEGERDSSIAWEFGTFAFGEALSYCSGDACFLENIADQWERWRSR